VRDSHASKSDEAHEQMNDTITAAILGLVEGATEFLPVSSTGHLIVAGNLLGFVGPVADCFEVFIQLGAILAVVVLYWRRFLNLVPGVTPVSSRSPAFAGWRGILMLIITTAPALVIGAIAHKAIKTYLFSPLTVAIGLAVGAVAILLVEKFKPNARTKSLDAMTYPQVLAVGICQCFSMWPGMSRSACTILGGLLAGADRKVATEYSFLAAVPVMLAAVSYDFYKHWSILRVEDLELFVVGFAVSFVSAGIAVKTFIGLVQRWSLNPYAWYRLAIAPLIYFFMRS